MPKERPKIVCYRNTYETFLKNYVFRAHLAFARNQFVDMTMDASMWNVPIFVQYEEKLQKIKKDLDEMIDSIEKKLPEIKYNETLAEAESDMDALANQN